MIGNTAGYEVYAFLTPKEFADLYQKKELIGEHINSNKAPGQFIIQVKDQVQPYAWDNIKSEETIDGIIITLNDEYAKEVCEEKLGVFCRGSYDFFILNTEKLKFVQENIYKNIQEK